MTKFSQTFDLNKSFIVNEFSTTPIGQIDYTPDLTTVGYGSVSGSGPNYLLEPGVGPEPLASVFSAEVVSTSFAINASFTIPNFSDPNQVYFGVVDSDSAVPTLFFDLLTLSPTATIPSILFLCTRNANSIDVSTFSGSITPVATSVPTVATMTPSEIVEFYVTETLTEYQLMVKLVGEPTDVMVGSALKTLAPNGLKICFAAVWFGTRNNSATIRFGSEGTLPSIVPKNGQSYLVNGPDFEVEPGMIAKDGDHIHYLNVTTPFLSMRHDRVAQSADVVALQTDVNTLTTNYALLEPRVDDTETAITILESTVSDHATRIPVVERGPAGGRRISSVSMGTTTVAIDTNVGANYNTPGTAYVLDLGSLFLTTSEVLVDLQNLPDALGPNGGNNADVYIQLGYQDGTATYTVQEGLLSFVTINPSFHAGFNLFIVTPSGNILYHRHYLVDQLNQNAQKGFMGLCTLQVGLYNGGIGVSGIDSSIFKVKNVVYEAIPQHCIYKFPYDLDMDVVSTASFSDIKQYRKANRLFFKITKGVIGSVTFAPTYFFSDYFITDLFIEVDSSKITTYNGQAIAVNTVFHYTAAITTNFYNGDQITTTPTFILQNKFTV